MTGPRPGASPEATLVGMLLAIDRLDWPSVRACLADPVTADYRELSGEAAATVPADDLVAQWQGLVPGFDATQHHLAAGLVVVDPAEPDRARLDASIRAFHLLRSGEEQAVWGVHGRYAVEFQRVDSRWLIAAITLHVAYTEGSDDIPVRAARRAAEDPHTSRSPDPAD